MLSVKNISNKKKFLLILLTIFLIPTLLDHYVNSKRVSLWEPDDAEHYILKKTQLQYCLIKKCEFNKNVQSYIQDKFLDDDQIIKRSVLDYHPFYSSLLLFLEKIFLDQYIAFKVLNYFASFLMIFFSLNFFKNYFKENFLKSNSLILTITILIFFTFTLAIWRDAFKLNFGIFIYLIDKLINFPKKTKKIHFYLVNLMQIFIHPAGIVCCFIITFLHYLNLVNYKFKNIFIFNNNYRDYIYLLITLLITVVYFFNGLIYVDLNINISNVFDGGSKNIFYINLTNLVNYFFSFNGIIIPLLIIVILEKKIKSQKVFLLILLLIIFFHIFNPSPNKNIINMFDFFFKFYCSIIIFKIFIDYKKKIIILFAIIIFGLQTIYLTINAYQYISARSYIDNISYSKESIEKKSFFINKKNLIIIDGDNDYILYHHLNHGLINRKIYYTGFSDKNLSIILDGKKEFYLIFDLFNNSFDLINNKKNSTKSFSKFLNNGDILSIQNNDLNNFYIQLRLHSSGELLINKEIVKVKKGQILKIEILRNSSTEIEIKKISKYVEILELNDEFSNNFNFPWKKNIILKIYNNYLNDKISIDFRNVNINSNCKIKKIFEDKNQDIYAKAICK